MIAARQPTTVTATNSVRKENENHRRRGLADVSAIGFILAAVAATKPAAVRKRRGRAVYGNEYMPWLADLSRPCLTSSSQTLRGY